MVKQYQTESRASRTDTAINNIFDAVVSGSSDHYGTDIKLGWCRYF
jgi:hypothetical protein